MLPLAAEFQPDVVLVSAGFDAARYDPLGKCHVSPQAFAAMTQQLMKLAKGRLCLFLEGGYHLTALSDSALACVHALLGDTCPAVTGIPDVDRVYATASGAASIKQTLLQHRQFWKFAAQAVPAEEQAADAAAVPAIPAAATSGEDTGAQ